MMFYTLLRVLLITTYSIVYGYMGSLLAFYVGGFELQLVHMITVPIFGFVFGWYVAGALVYNLEHRNE